MFATTVLHNFNHSVLFQIRVHIEVAVMRLPVNPKYHLKTEINSFKA